MIWFCNMFHTFWNEFSKIVSMLIWIILFNVVPTVCRATLGFYRVRKQHQFPGNSCSTGATCLPTLWPVPRLPRTWSDGTVTCSPGPSRGRYVFISLPIPGVLTMCETWVFASRSTPNLTVRRHCLQTQIQYKTNTSEISFTDIIYRIPGIVKIPQFLIGCIYSSIPPSVSYTNNLKCTKLLLQLIMKVFGNAYSIQIWNFVSPCHSFSRPNCYILSPQPPLPKPQ